MEKRMNTLGYYNENAEEYFEKTKGADLQSTYSRFEKHLPTKGRILDLGCGSGRDSKYFISQGYTVTPLDGSRELAKLASDYLSMPVACKEFKDIAYKNEFDAIWACASLLHLPKDDLDGVLQRLYDSLIEDGLLYLSLKKGDGEINNDGRYYSLYQTSEISQKLKDSGFICIENWESEDTLKRDTVWINIFARKCENIEQKY